MPAAALDPVRGMTVRALAKGVLDRWQFRIQQAAGKHDPGSGPRGRADAALVLTYFEYGYIK